MSSLLTDAVIGSFTAQFDPEKKSVANFMATQSAEMSIATEEKRAALISKVDKLINAAKESGDSVNPTVLEAYDRILARLSSAAQ